MSCPKCPHQGNHHDERGCNFCRCGHLLTCTCQRCRQANEALIAGEVELLRTSIARSAPAQLTEEERDHRPWRALLFDAYCALLAASGPSPEWGQIRSFIRKLEDALRVLQPVLTEEERAEVEGARDRHVGDSAPDDMDGDEWMEMAETAHGHRGALLRIIDRLAPPRKEQP